MGIVWPFSLLTFGVENGRGIPLKHLLPVQSY